MWEDEKKFDGSETSSFKYIEALKEWARTTLRIYEIPIVALAAARRRQSNCDRWDANNESPIEIILP